MMFVIRNDSNLEGSPPNTESSRRKGQVTLQPSRSRSRSNFGNLVRPGVLWQSWFKRAWFPWRSQNIIDKRWFLGTWRRLEAAVARNKPSMLLRGKNHPSHTTQSSSQMFSFTKPDYHPRQWQLSSLSGQCWTSWMDEFRLRTDKRLFLLFKIAPTDRK